MICREKYVDLCVLSPRGQVIKALIKAHEPEFLKRGGYSLLAQICWGVTFEKWPGNVIANNRSFYAMDQWLESLLFQEASRLS